MASSTLSWESVRSAGACLTTPLHPDDYLSLINPLWSSRELRGRIEDVTPETEDAATVVIRPGWGLHFTEEELEDETRSEWYLRQIPGAADFDGGPLLHILSGNLGFQIEHHLYPDLPYTTGPLWRQYGQALRTIIKLTVPNSWTSNMDDSGRDRRRRSDAERPSRRTELGVWVREGEHEEES